MHHILVVEDNPSDAETIKIFLKEAGFKHKLSVTESLQDTFRLIGDSKIDLVLLDLSLTDSKGFDTLRTYLKKAPDTPVIVFTGTNNQVVGMQCVKAGAQDFLIKGEFGARRLVNSIRYSLERFKSNATLKKQADELTRTEKRLNELHRLAQFGDWEMDLVSNAMHWSDQMFEIFGYKPRSFAPTRSDYMSHVHVEDREMVEQFFNESIRTGEANEIKHRITIDNRQIRKLLVRAQIRFNTDSNKILLLGSLQDITNQQADKEEFSGTAIDPLPPQEQEPISRFSFNVRTPLSSIVNLLYLLEESPLSDHQQSLLRDLKISVDELSFLLSNLVNLSLISQEKADLLEEEMQTEHFLQHLQRVLNFKSERARTSLDVRIAPDLPARISGDLEKINQFIYSLIDQAILLHKRRLPMRLEISAKPKEKDQLLLHFDLKYSGEQLDLDSNWTPVDMKEWMPLLNSEYNSDNRKKISTLTLRRLSDILGTSIQMSEQRAEEVHIQFDLPVRQVTHTNTVSKNHEFSLDRSLRILLVEDHTLNQIATKKVLTNWSDSVNVDIAVNGEEALKVFNGNYDLILMDLQMPLIDGMTAATRIREQSQVPIIALTASASKEEEQKCLRLGFNSYLAKPIKPRQLYQRIMEVIDS